MVFGLSLDEAARLHGHKGPWLVIGYRAGMRAREVLKPRSEHELVCIVKTPKKTPYTCSIDGIQASTGCTLGKLSILIIGIEESEPIEFLFKHRVSGKELLLRLRSNVINIIEKLYGEGGLEASARWVEEAKLRDLFEEIIK